ncbi:hypothetical protein TCAL_06235 [Tigriopus californicus]|uniref:Uncharacterized protein n=1 Tax=Tigriopus californicus TaxID=6832 RepID=A0A553N9E0_TIGCA|nr:hypothetical protein TCAL_06235 [Tigriopus californicus]
MKSFGLCVFSCLISICLVVFVVVVVEVEAFPHAQRGEWYQTYSQDHQPHFSPVNPGFPLLNTKSKTREWHTNYASSGNSVLTKRQSAVSLNPLEMVSNKLRELGQQVVKGFSKLTRFDTRDQDSFSRDFLQPSIDSDSDDYLFDYSHGSQTYSSSGSVSPGSYFNDGDARSSVHNEIPPSSYHYYTPNSASSSDSGSFSLPSDERVQLTSASTSDHYSSSPSEAFFVDHPTRHVVSHQPQSSGGKPSFFEYVANDLKKAGDWMMGMLGMETYPDGAHDGHKDRLIIDQNMANGQHPYLTDFPESPFADLLYEEYLASSGASTQAPFYPNAEFSHSQGQGEYIAEPATAATTSATKPPVPIKLLISAQVAREHADEVRTLPIEVVAGSDTTRLVLELPASHTKDLHSPTLIKTTGGSDGASIGVEALTANGNEYKTTIEAKKANGLQSKVDSYYDDIVLVSTEEHDNNIGDENAIIQREDKTFMRVYDKTLGRSILREMNNIYRPVASRPSLTKDFFYQASDQTTQESETQTSGGPNPNPPIFESEIDENQNNVALTSQDADSVDLGQIATSQAIIESDKSDDTALYIVQAPGDIDYEFLLPELRDNEDDYNHSKDSDIESNAEPEDLEPEATTLSAVVNKDVPTSDGALIIYPTSDDDTYPFLTQGATTTSESTSTVITSSVSSTAQIGLSKGATKLSDWTRKLEAALSSSSSSQDDPTSIPQLETEDLGPKADFALSAGQSSSINQTTTTDEGLVPVSSSSVLAPKTPTETLTAGALLAGEDHLLDQSKEKKSAKEGAVKKENTLNGLFIEDDWDNSNIWQGETSQEADQLRELLVTRKKLLHKLKEKRKDKKQILLAKLKKD